MSIHRSRTRSPCSRAGMVGTRLVMSSMFIVHKDTLECGWSRLRWTTGSSISGRTTGSDIFSTKCVKLSHALHACYRTISNLYLRAQVLLFNFDWVSRCSEKTGCYEARRKEEEVQRKDWLLRREEERGGGGAEKRPVAMTGGLRKEEEVLRKDWL